MIARWGYHLIVDAANCVPSSIVEAVLNKHFLPENVKTRYLERQAEHNDPPGW